MNWQWRTPLAKRARDYSVVRDNRKKTFFLNFILFNNILNHHNFYFGANFSFSGTLKPKEIYKRFFILTSSKYLFIYFLFDLLINAYLPKCVFVAGKQMRRVFINYILLKSLNKYSRIECFFANTSECLDRDNQHGSDFQLSNVTLS